MKFSSLLFITSFIPTIVFKVIARMGEPTVSQARTATVVGLTLALAQIIVSRKVLKENTYLEWAFLGFLSAGALWVFAAPLEIAQIYVVHNTTLLYFILFLTTLLPQLMGYDPFTYTIAKQWQPEAVWGTPQFKTINLHITRVFSVIMFLAFVSNAAGHGQVLYSIVIPIVLILGVGIPFSRKYPKYYLNRQAETMKPASTIHFPDTVKELILKMPHSFDQAAAGSLKALIQYIISGEGGGSFVLSIDNGTCTSTEGTVPDPDLVVRSPADVWMKISKGEINPPKALMDGLYKAEGNMELLVNLKRYFSK